ncbi:MAG: 2'-deoxycytidine 5'-triphosphate deaminase [Bacteroidota bacterium]
MIFKEHIRDRLSLGVLNLDHILELIDEKIVLNIDRQKLEKYNNENKSSALDLTISNIGWEVGKSFKPQLGEKVEGLMKKYAKGKLKRINQGVVLEKGNVYLFQIEEQLDLKNEFKLYAQASGKSSIGRLDVLTRLVIDGSPLYDEISNGYKGKMFVEIIPLSFPILIKTGNSVNQLRLFRGEPTQSKLGKYSLDEIGDGTPLILDKNGETRTCGIDKLSIDLSVIDCGGTQTCAYEAKSEDNGIEPIDLSSNSLYNPEKYWRRLPPDKGTLKMEKDHFYILRSCERFYLLEDIAVRCIAYTENLGETRIHYAGFAHPWFSRKSKNGAPLIFEVRCHSFPIVARHKEDFARIEFYRMAEPTKVFTPYESQELKLSKYFDAWK